jgi:hypothetical protein
VLAGWVFFRMAEAPVARSFAYLGAMVGRGATAEGVAAALAEHLADPVLRATLLLAGLVTVAPLLGLPAAWRDAPVADRRQNAALALTARTAVAGVLFLASVAALASGRFNPFIYFRF